MNLSLAITTYNRFDFTVESFAQVLDDPRIDDIIILDDCSTDGSYEQLVKHFKGVEKVRVMRQAKNRGMSLNKRDAISYAKNEWVIIFDSDNIIGKSYLDALQRAGVPLNAPSTKIILTPEYAKPQFDYRKFASQLIDRNNVIDLIKDDIGNCLLNTCNYIVHRDTYLSVYEHNPEMKGTDTIWFNYLWLKAGNYFNIVQDMQYFHRVHSGSGFLEDAGYNMKQAEKVRKMIMSL